jgi:hypothetical protein
MITIIITSTIMAITTIMIMIMIMITGTGIIITVINIMVTTMIRGICRVGKGASQTFDSCCQIGAAPCPRVCGHPLRRFHAWARRCVLPVAKTEFAVRVFAHPSPFSPFALAQAAPMLRGSGR